MTISASFGYLIWIWLREGKSSWFAIAGAIILRVTFFEVQKGAYSDNKFLIPDTISLKRYPDYV
jgi:hypothetical protein